MYDLACGSRGVANTPIMFDKVAIAAASDRWAAYMSAIAPARAAYDAARDDAASRCARGEISTFERGRLLLEAEAEFRAERSKHEHLQRPA